MGVIQHQRKATVVSSPLKEQKVKLSVKVINQHAYKLCQLSFTLHKERENIFVNKL